MRLFEHPDFGQAILRTADHFQDQRLRPSVIEKDYYVTEALRILTNVAVTKSSSKVVQVFRRVGI